MQVSASLDIAPEELLRRLEQGEDLAVLDVRSAAEAGAWRIETTAETPFLNVPFEAFLEDLTEAVARVPKDRPVAVVCGRGRTSVYVTEVLRGAGLQAFSLAGGMRAWSELYRPRRFNLTERVSVWQLDRLAKGCLSYVIAAGGEALVVDPGRDVEQYLRLAAEQGLALKYVADTHLHADHVSGGRELAVRAGVPYYLSPADAADVTFSYDPLTPDVELSLGSESVQVKAVPMPGHTPGSTALVIDGKALLTGDALFIESIGRPDLGGQAGAWVEDLYQTVGQDLTRLPGELQVFPAHYASSSERGDLGVVTATLETLRRTNRALKVTSREEFRLMILGGMPEQPANYQVIRRINKGLISPGDDLAGDLETGPNRCAATGA